MYIKVRVTPGAKKEEVEKKGDRWSIEVRQEAQMNQANKRVIEIIAGEHGVLPKEVRIISGHHHPNKILSVNKED